MALLWILCNIPYFLFQDIDIKKQGSNGAYAFIQYLDITHAVEARKQMNRALSGRNRLKVRTSLPVN